MPSRRYSGRPHSGFGGHFGPVIRAGSHRGPAHGARGAELRLRDVHRAREIGLSPEAQGDLYYALLMKDAGCSTNASRMFQILGTDDIKAKRDLKTTDWTLLGWESLEYGLSHVRTGAPFLERIRALFDTVFHQERNAKELVQIRCERGASIARRIGLSDATACAIHSLDELWNGSGQPEGLRGEEIPLFARIMNLAQTVDVFCTVYGRKAALDIAKKRSRRWFDPDLVRALHSAAKKEALWADVDDAARKVIQLEPHQDLLPADEATLDRICLAFADVIDAKSPFTYRHSTGVAGAAVAIAKALEMSASEVTLIRRAALLHDIGKLSVPNTILDKPAKLTVEEWSVVQRHPYYSYEILRRIPSFADLSEIAASHHEKLNGTGYFRGLTADRLPCRLAFWSFLISTMRSQRSGPIATHFRSNRSSRLCRGMRRELWMPRYWRRSGVRRRPPALLRRTYSACPSISSKSKINALAFRFPSLNYQRKLTARRRKCRPRFPYRAS